MAKYGFEISGSLEETFERMAKEKGLTKAELIRRALATYTFLDREARDDLGVARVEIAERDGKPRREVILP